MEYQTPQATIVHFSPHDVLASSQSSEKAAWEAPGIDLDFY